MSQKSRKIGPSGKVIACRAIRAVRRAWDAWAELNLGAILVRGREKGDRYQRSKLVHLERQTNRKTRALSDGRRESGESISRRDTKLGEGLKSRAKTRQKKSSRDVRVFIDRDAETGAEVSLLAALPEGASSQRQWKLQRLSRKERNGYNKREIILKKISRLIKPAES